MNSYKKLLSNSVIFSVGSLGSKIVSFILLPLYTFYLTTGEFGTVDLVIATSTMLVPVVSLSMQDAVLRFAMDDSQKRDLVLSSAFFIGFIGLMLSLILYPVLNLINGLNNYIIFLYLLLFVEIFEIITSQYARGIGRSKLFALNGFLLSLNTGLLNLLFIVVFDLGINGYLIATFLSYLISSIFLAVKLKLHKTIKISAIKKDVIKNLITYSVPLIPNSVMWALINASSRYFILFYLGVKYNGLFAVASRIPAIINIISSVFSQAWQLSAIEEFENVNRSKFYNSIFEILSSVMFLSTFLIIIILKPGFKFIFDLEYYNAWEVVPFMLIGIVFSSFASFFGSIYIASKKTSGVFKTSIYGGLISLVLNLLLIPKIGLIGTGIASMISFLVMFIARVIDTKKIIHIEINWKKIWLNLIILLSVTLVLLSTIEMTLEMIIILVSLVMMLIVNRKFFLSLKFGLNKIIKKQNNY